MTTVLGLAILCKRAARFGVSPARLQTRVGIATGLVVVGDIVDAGGAQERGIIARGPGGLDLIAAVAALKTHETAPSAAKLQ